MRLSRQALVDLQAIYRQGVRQFGEQQAISYQRALHEAFRLISEFPEANRVRTEFARPYRIQRHEAHLIFYRIEKGEVYIVRVRHGHEDWTPDI
ncbi:type II toxin-antitoxin system RelE/ParE family toxin [Hyphomonas sp. WL0036]|nr:type II toxin-antitoxin system RelE/ParE family toxin [Hyphomonas sediminis]MBY9066677.1 type II toxin-antitoxin system RelE/ParE family toxin [Hyphomonas sediminis]